MTDAWWNGFAFWPATGMVAFSDHRLGESLIASPFQWAGAGPIAAYNATLLLTFPLSAMAAYWLAFVLTRRHGASFLAGLAYGFNPYRAAHIEHLELLAAFGMPAALAALHLYLTQRRTRWLVAFAAALLLQALCASYYFVFFGVMLVLWGAWFLRRGDSRVAIGAAVAVAAVVAAISPLAWSYLAIHRQYGFTRGLYEIVTLSADVASYAKASPLVALWGWTSRVPVEEALFPGVSVVVLIALGVASALRSETLRLSANRLSMICVAIGVALALIAGASAYFGPRKASLGPLTLSIGTPFKPFSLALWALAIAVLVSSPLRHAYSRRSPGAFYLLAALFLALCSLGPKPRFLGSQFLYEPPYAWLMRGPVFGESVREPGRFAMLVVLALAMAAALSFARLTRTRRNPALVVTLAAVGLVADGWIGNLPMLPPPTPWPSQVPTAGVVAFLEVPFGDIYHDTAAMFRAVAGSLPTANGYSGYEPSYYKAARHAFGERDDSVLDAFASRGPLIVSVDRQAPWTPENLAWVRAYPHATALGDHADRTWFLVSPPPPVKKAACAASVLPIASARDQHGSVDLRPLTDGDNKTSWTSGPAQQAGDGLELDLANVVTPCSVRMSLGARVDAFPRRLSVSTSTDASAWQTPFEGATAGAAVLAGIERPLDARLEIPLGNLQARFVRLRLEASQSDVPWIVTEVVITGQ